MTEVLSFLELQTFRELAPRYGGERWWAPLSSTAPRLRVPWGNHTR